MDFSCTFQTLGIKSHYFQEEQKLQCSSLQTQKFYRNLTTYTPLVFLSYRVTVLCHKCTQYYNAAYQNKCYILWLHRIKNVFNEKVVYKNKTKHSEIFNAQKNLCFTEEIMHRLYQINNNSKGAVDLHCEKWSAAVIPSLNYFVLHNTIQW